MWQRKKKNSERANDRCDDGGVSDVADSHGATMTRMSHKVPQKEKDDITKVSRRGSSLQTGSAN